MVSKEEILQQFKDLSLSLDDKSLEKCVEICLSYDLTAEELVDTWSAYSLTNLKGEGPTVEHLQKMERKEFQKGKEVKKKTSISTPSHEEIYRPSPVRNSIGTPKSNHAPVSRIQTPVQAKKILDDSYVISSPGTRSASYASRSDVLSVRCTYGPNSQFKNEKSLELHIKEAGEDCLKADGNYMYEILREKMLVLSNVTDFMAHEIMMQNRLTPLEGHLKNHVNKEVVTYGRIVSNDSGGKLNSQSILLEGTKRTNLGQCSQLNLSKIPKYSIFPGQTAVVKGIVLQGNKIMVNELYTDTNMLLPEEPPFTQDSLQMVVACGPFTTQDNLQFEPLKDLLLYVNEHKPHVLMLLGPFYERNNEGIMNGELTESFDELFQQLLESLMGTVNNDTHVIVVSSSREPHHHPVYPTMPYSFREKRENLTLVPEPCIVNINGLLVAATTADVLFHISNYEMHQDRTGASDRLGRIASHLLKQHCFYPLDPPFRGMRVEHFMLDRYGMIDVKPHVMILPSNFRYFVKSVEDCLVINPERLTKGVGGGTFAHVEIKAGHTLSVCERTSCKIVKI